MKLVEILARELTEWPEGTNFIFQDYDGEVWGDAGDDSLYTSSNICEEHRKIGDDFPTSLKDKYCSLVTRAQWEAERARILKMDPLVAARDNPPISQYEQELWDKVAIQAIGRLGNITSLSEAADAVASLADAFMAERAKRLKQ